MNAAPCHRDHEIAHRVQRSEWSGPNFHTQHKTSHCPAGTNTITNPEGSCVPIGPSDVHDQHCLAMRAARPLPNLLSNFCQPLSNVSEVTNVWHTFIQFPLLCYTSVINSVINFLINFVIHCPKSQLNVGK